jgi:hypothetical protein
MNLFTTKASLVFVAFFILLSTKQLSAQESNDLEGWSALQIDIKGTKKLSFSVAEHLRYKKDISTLSNYFTQLETSYEIFQDFQIGAGVRFIKKNDDIGNRQGIESHFRYQLDALYQHEVKQLNLSYRLRYQNKNELGFSEEEGDIPKEQLRFMLAIGYKLRPIRVVFKLKGELFSTISDGAEPEKIDRNRFTLLASRKFNKIGKFSLFYRIQEDINTIEENVNKSIIGLKYSYSLDLRRSL